MKVFRALPPPCIILNANRRTKNGVGLGTRLQCGYVRCKPRTNTGSKYGNEYEMSTDEEDYYKLLGCSETSTASFVVINVSTYRNLPKIGLSRSKWAPEVGGPPSHFMHLLRSNYELVPRAMYSVTVTPGITYSSNESPLEVNGPPSTLKLEFKLPSGSPSM